MINLLDGIRKGYRESRGVEEWLRRDDIEFQERSERKSRGKQEMRKKFHNKYGLDPLSSISIGFNFVLLKLYDDSDWNEEYEVSIRYELPLDIPEVGSKHQYYLSYTKSNVRQEELIAEEKKNKSFIEEEEERYLNRYIHYLHHYKKSKYRSYSIKFVNDYLKDKRLFWVGYNLIVGGPYRLKLFYEDSEGQLCVEGVQTMLGDKKSRNEIAFKLIDSMYERIKKGTT